MRIISTVDVNTTLAGIQKTRTTADGVWTVTNRGVVTFNPDSDFKGTSVNAYTVQDDDGNQSVPVNISITVRGASPVATADSGTALADNIVTVDLSNNVSDPNDDVDISTIDINTSVTGIQKVRTTADGLWSVSNTGLLQFDPDSDFEGTKVNSYTVRDRDGNQSEAANVSVTVEGAIPQASAGSVTVPPNANALIVLADNISDANNDVLISTIDINTTNPGIQKSRTTADGVWSVSELGVVTFNPNDDFEGTAVNAYTVSDDDENQSLPANLSITVRGAIPVAKSSVMSGEADTSVSINLANNVSDANNDVVISTIDVDITVSGIQKTRTTDDGIWSVNDSGLVTFNPNSDFEGTALNSYTVSDNDGNVSSAADMSITIAGAFPVAIAASGEGIADAIVSIDLINNVSDANNDIDISSIDINENDDDVQKLVTTNDGVWSVNEAGLLSFDPSSDFFGIASISYTVQDDDGNESSAANVTVNIAAAAPVATSDRSAVGADETASVDLSDNISDSNNDVDIATIDINTSVEGIQKSKTTSDGVWSVSTEGLLVFNPNSDFEGEASNDYTVWDDDENQSEPATVFITVAGATPVVVSDSVVLPADTNAIVNLALNISDANNDVDISTLDIDTTLPGIQSTRVTEDGAWSVDSVGILTFDPDRDFEGTTSNAYTVQDDDGNQSEKGEITIIVDGATPVATAISVVVPADTNANIDLSDKVSDANNDVDISTIDINRSITGVQNTYTSVDGVWTVNEAGLLSFNPDSDFEGTTTVDYTVKDDDDNQSFAVTISVLVEGAYPVATSSRISVGANVNASTNLASRVSDANNDIDIGTLDLDLSNAGVQNTLTTADGVWSVTVAGGLTFNPDTDFEGLTTISFSVQDDDGNSSEPALISVTVEGAVPIVVDTESSTGADESVTVQLSEFVSDDNNDIIISSFDLDTDTDNEQQELTTNDGVWSIDDLGLLSFNPNSDFEGFASMSYTVKDDDGNESNQGIVTIEVDGAIPVALGEITDVGPDSIATVDLSSKVSDANNDIDLNTIDLDLDSPGIQNTFVDTLSVWSVDTLGVVTFDPAAVFEGTTRISYTVQDDDGNKSEPAIISVTVAGAIPVATSDAVSVLANTNASLDLSDNVSDANNDVLLNTLDLDIDLDGIQNRTTTPDGTWFVDPTGLVTFDPNTSFEGLSSIQYTVGDDDGNVSSPVLIEVTVGSATPIADDDAATIVQRFAVRVDILSGDSDANNNIIPSSIDLNPDQEGQQLQLEIVGEGVYEVDSEELLFTPEVQFYGTTSILYTVSDETGNTSNKATVKIVVLHDTDADSVANIDDLDDDNDGIPDLKEGDTDTDGDGLVDSLDVDSDNDGLTDLTEAGGLDADANGVVDDYIDENNDGHDDLIGVLALPTENTDSDDLPNYKDLDSDNDGLSDIRETGGTDTDGNGVVDGFSDADGNGLHDERLTVQDQLPDFDADEVPNYLDKDSDNDTLSDAYETGGVDSDGDGELDTFEDLNKDGFNDSVAGTEFVARDSDLDLKEDYLDVDSDNDTIPDSVEGAIDTDQDNLPDYVDTDSDADGISDEFETQGSEGVLDSEKDGIPDQLDIDSDNDLIPDAVEGVNDADRDSRFDYLDLDSDNDGIFDKIESQSRGADSDSDGIDDAFDLDVTLGADENRNGIDDSFELSGSIDTDGDELPDVQDSDSDGDGIPDTIEGLVDTDNDGTPDYLDTDSDADGIPDGVEAQVSGKDSDKDGIDDIFDVDETGGADEDKDGVDDGVEEWGTVDTDGDGLPNALEKDSDNDNISDAFEAGIDVTQPVDTDGDGWPDYIDTDADGDGLDDIVETVVDSDEDGVADYLDNDTDNDGLSDLVEGVADTDDDGLPNYLDLDSDNDGIPDLEEASFQGERPYDTDGDSVFDYLDHDADNDGVSDFTEGYADTDRDGLLDFRDLDSDNDGIFDIIEIRLEVDDITTIDTDLDGMIDLSFEHGLNGMADIIESSIDSGLESYELSDVDSDGILDFRDLDSDNDGLLDTVESDHADNNLDGIIDSELTANLFLDESVNGESDDRIQLFEVGGIPRNSDLDGLADFRDPDSDNDGIMDVVESFGQDIDADKDGVMDSFADDNGNGISDSFEEEPMPAIDTDGDGVLDALEIDSDGDGLTDVLEAGGFDIDGDGVIDNFVDDDGNGVDDGVEFIALELTDTDADGTPDFRDIDSDDDGITDFQESGAVDADGDGVADAPVPSAARPDMDKNGIPDHLEILDSVTNLGLDGAFSPLDIPAQSAALNDASIETGLGGGACSIAPIPTNAYKVSSSTWHFRFDPVLPALGIIAMFWLMRGLFRRDFKV